MSNADDFVDRGKRASPDFKRVIDMALPQEAKNEISYEFIVDDVELKQRLEPAQFCVARECGTEMPFSGKLLNIKEDGTFNCVICSTPLFMAETKFNSGTGWPSFTRPASPNSLQYFKDNMLENRPRIEVCCSRCGAHLGHVFDEGPKPGQLRYCVNSLSLTFEAQNSRNENEIRGEKVQK